MIDQGGDPYYHCAATGETRWAPPGWDKYIDQASGHLYYHCAETGETTWARPTMRPMPAAPLPPHVLWFASMPAVWRRGITVPRDEQRCSTTEQCSWHSAGDGYVGDLNLVVGTYNIIEDIEALWRWFQSLEVTLFRADRQMWQSLQDVLTDKHRRGDIVILNGKPDANKWLHISCVHCGRYVFVEYPTKGCYCKSDEELARGRQKLFEFSMLSYRHPESELRREV